MKRIPVILAIATLLIVSLLWIVPVRYPSALFTPIRGLDISHHQGKINWDTVSVHEQIGFVWIKASEGGDFRDSLFTKNWARAKEAGIPRGAYHFLTFCKSGREQARNFIDAVGEFSDSDLIPMIDIEYGGNCSERLTHEEMKRLITDFTEELLTVSKNPPILYLTRDIYRNYFKEEYHDYRIWGRAIYYSPRRIYGNRWKIWQYNHRGTVAGIHGPVDLNVLSEKSLDSYYNK